MRARVAALGLLLLLPLGCDDWPGLESSGDNEPISGGSQIDDSTGQLGSSCGTGRSACMAGLSCMEDFPSGMCTMACESDSDCGGGRCVLGIQGLLCYKGCASSQTCRPGYSCVSDGTVSVCTPGS